jgi:thioredoxin 1
MVSNFLDNAGVDYDRVDVFKSPDIASQYGIMSTPVTILFDDDGSEIQRSVGFKPDELNEMIAIL